MKLAGLITTKTSRNKNKPKKENEEYTYKSRIYEASICS